MVPKSARAMGPGVPVVWADQMQYPELPDGTLPAGVIGTDIFYRFLTTLDFANRNMVLRPRTTSQRQRFRTQARRARAEVLPLWLANDHLPLTLGSLNDYGPRVVLLDSGAEPLHHRRTGVVLGFGVRCRP